MKPSLAEDADLSKVTFPVRFFVKIDGVRALNLQGQLTGRSLDPFKGFGITEYFSKPEFLGLDGEMVLGDKPNCDQRLCSLTTGAMGRFKGVTELADLHWWVFDLVTAETVNLPYSERHQMLEERVKQLNHPRIHLVPSVMLDNREELDYFISQAFENGFEGAVLRTDSPYKEGRSDKRQQLTRIKPWADFEILVTGLTEGDRNDNAATTNSLGRTERSSAKAGKVPNGQVGSVQGTLLADFYDPISKKLLFAKGLAITAGSGEMSVAEAKHYFENQHELIGRFAKIKNMTHGVKLLPRFPTFVSIRLPEDIS